MPSAPLVSVGLPVFNGERFLPASLASLMAQTFTDFELVISDNASTDRTPEICQDLARSDSRVRYFRQRVNIGAPANWNFVAREARGRFFKWCSDSDVCLPPFLESCSAQLLKQPQVVLCAGKTGYVDVNDNAVKMPENDIESLELRPSERFRHICLKLCLNNTQYGLIRRAALMQTRLDRPYPHGDLVLMAELAMLGKFVVLPETLLLRRVSPENWTGMMSTEQVDSLIWPGAKPRHPALIIRRHLDYVRSALTSPVQFSERFRAAAFALRFAYWRKGDIARDLRETVRGARPLHV